MALERMQLYIEEHPDVLEHIAANCTLFDEELIEFLNAKASRLCILFVSIAGTSPFRLPDWALVQPAHAECKY